MESTKQYDPKATIVVRQTDYSTGSSTDTTLNVYEVETMRRKINNLEQRLDAHEKMVTQIKENLTRDGWYADSTDKEDILRDLCSIVDHEPVSTLFFTATFTVEGTVEVPIEEAEDFDLRYLLNDEVSIATNNGNLDINSYYVEDIQSEDWT